MWLGHPASLLRATLDLPEGLPGIVMAIQTFGEYLDFHPHLHAQVADGLFVRSGLFHVLPDAGLKPLEELLERHGNRYCNCIITR